MRRRARSKMDDGGNDSKWTHNTSAWQKSSFQNGLCAASPQQLRRKTAVNVTLTMAAGHGVPALIIHSAAAPRPRLMRRWFPVEAIRNPPGTGSVTRHQLQPDGRHSVLLAVVS